MAPSADLIDRFAREYQAYHQISADRRRRQCKILRDLAATLDGRSLDECRRDDFQAFAGALLDQGLHVNTVRTKLNLIRPFFSWAYAAGVVTAEQYMGLKSVGNPRGATGQSVPRPYSKEELAAFWSALDASLPLLPERGTGSLAIRRWLVGKGRWRRVWRHAMRLQVEAIVALALDCGLRRIEIFGLSLNDLHYDNEYIVVTGAKKGGDGQAKVRKVPYTETAREKVKAWIEFRSLIRPTHERPWLSLYGHAYNKPMSFDRMEELLLKLVGPGWELHRLRHTCATLWLRSGMPLEGVKELLGHASLQQTLAYAQLLESDIARHIAKHEGDFAAMTGREAA